MNKEMLEALLFLVADNMRTSASTPGLNHRQENNAAMEEILCQELEMDIDDVDTFYTNKLRKLEE